MGFRNYQPGLGSFDTRDMYSGAGADMALTSDPFSGGAYAFGDANPIINIEVDGHFFDVGNLPSGYRPGSQNSAKLSPEEQQAVDNKKEGLPYDQKAYNSAQQKIRQAQKYAGQRNKQKRSGNNKSNFVSTAAKDALITVAAVAVVAVVVVVAVITLPIDAIVAAGAAIVGGISAGLAWAF